MDWKRPSKENQSVPLCDYLLMQLLAICGGSVTIHSCTQNLLVKVPLEFLPGEVLKSPWQGGECSVQWKAWLIKKQTLRGSGWTFQLSLRFELQDINLPLKFQIGFQHKKQMDFSPGTAKSKQFTVALPFLKAGILVPKRTPCQAEYFLFQRLGQQGSLLEGFLWIL